MTSIIRYGILGPGKIAHKFADAFQRVPGTMLQAVASRDRKRSEEFSAKWNIPIIHDSYQALAKDPTVDIVYIATPHPFHYEQTMLCLKHHKPVLCEKPLTMTYRQAHEMITLSQARKTFLMEGMWSRFFPATNKALELVRNGSIGQIKFVRADFGFAAPFNPDGRIFNLALGGGAQLDVGVYPMFLILLLLGRPEKIQALIGKAATGADETTSVQFYFKDGAIGHILSSIVADTPKQADIVGSEGTITMHTPWHKSQMITLKKNGAAPEQFDFPFPGIGFEFQLAHVTDCMQKGLIESELMSHDLSLLMAETADEILKQGGITYPDHHS